MTLLYFPFCACQNFVGTVQSLKLCCIIFTLWRYFVSIFLGFFRQSTTKLAWHFGVKSALLLLLSSCWPPTPLLGLDSPKSAGAIEACYTRSHCCSQACPKQKNTLSLGWMGNFWQLLKFPSQLFVLEVLLALSACQHWTGVLFPCLGQHPWGDCLLTYTTLVV